MTQYIAWPENFLWPYLQLSGLSLYKNIFFIYPPLYPLLLSGWFHLSGISLINLQAISYLNIVATDVLIYFVAKKRLWPLLIYVPLQIFFEGNGFWPDQLLAPIFLSCWFLLSRKKYIQLGMILGLALLIKQTALYFIVVIGIKILFDRISIKSWGQILAGGFAVFFLAGIYFLSQNNFYEFIQQNFIYIFSHHVTDSLQAQWPDRQQFFLTVTVFLPAIFIGMRAKRFWETILMITAGLGVFTRFEYFHLQPALPFAAILLSESVIALPFIFIFLYFFIRFTFHSYQLPPRFLATDLIADAKIINKYIPSGSKTLIFNSWDHYYYLTGTLPVGSYFFSSTPWNWSYNGIQEKEVKILEDTRPTFVVYGSCFRIGNICHQPELIGSYIRSHYSQVSKLPDGTGIFQYDPVGP